VRSSIEIVWGWSEWARNRDRLSRPAEEEPAEDDAEEIESDDEPEEIEPEARVAEEEAEADVESPLNEDLRAEPAHDHAPFSQLFGKMRMSS